MADFRVSKAKKKGEQSTARPVAVTPDPEVSRSLLAKVGVGAASGLHTIGSILSTPSRVLWGSINGLAGGDGGFGNMNPLDSTGGIELSHVLGNAGVIAKNDPTKWEWGDLGRGLVDIAGDPTSYLGAGVLTKSGVGAAKAGTLAATKLQQVAKGERALLSVVNPLTRAPIASVGHGAGVASALEQVGQKTGLSRVVKAAHDSDLATYMRQKFHASAMNRSTVATQGMAKSAFREQDSRLADVDLMSSNAVRNMQNVGPSDPRLEMHRIEMGKPGPEIAPLVGAAHASHKEYQDVGGKIADLNNSVKQYTKAGPKRALVTRVYDNSGNIVRRIDNTVGDPGLQYVKNAPLFNELHPNTAVQYAPRQLAEGIEYGGGGAYKASPKTMSAHTSIDQHRNTELHGNASTGLINRVYAKAGEHLASLPAGLSVNQQQQKLAKFIQREFRAEDVKAGTNLTGYFSKGSSEAKTVHSRPRELANFIVANPQLAKTGPFTNHPIADLHSYLANHAEKIPKAKASLKFMGQAAFVGRKGKEVFAEPLEEVAKYGLNPAAVNNTNSPMVRHALGQLGLNEKEAHAHVFRHLPANVKADVMAEAKAEATRQATAKLARFTAQNGHSKVLQDTLEAKLLPKTLENSVLNLHLPAKEYKSLTGFADDAARPMEGKIADYTKVLKANLLAMPATHSRNAFSAFVTNLLQGTGGIRELKHAADLHLGKDISGYAHLPEVASLMKSQGITESEALRRLAATHLKSGDSLHGDLPIGQIGSQLSDLAESVPGSTVSTVGKAIKAPLAAAVGYKDGKHVGWDAAKPWKIAKAFGNEETKYGPAMASEILAKGIEQPIRLAGMLGAMKQGYTAKEAAKLVGRGQVNYGSREYSQFEKQLKQIIPFYSFGSRQGKHVLNELTSDPGGRMAQVIKAQNRANTGDDSIPDYIQSGTSLPVGQSADGTKNFITGFGLAHEPAVQTLGALANMDPRSAAYDLFAQLHPGIRVPLEQTFQKSAFQRGEDMSNMDPNIGRALSNVGVGLGLRDEHAGPVKYAGSGAVESLIGVSPLSRLASTARSVTDTRKGLPEKAMNLLTGIRSTAVSPKKQQYTIIKKAEQIAKDSGAKSRQDVYFNKDELARLKESDPALYERQVGLQKLLNNLKSGQRSNVKKAPKPKSKITKVQKAPKSKKIPGKKFERSQR